MTIFYSPAAGGFFDSGINQDIPGDAREISVEVHAELLEAQAAGMAIVAGPDGAPIATTPAGPSEAELVAGARRLRAARLRESDWALMPDSPLSEAQQAPWRVYRQALRNVPQQPGWPASIDWPVAPEGQA